MRRGQQHPLLVMLERDASKIVGPDWSAKVNKNLLESPGRRRKYDGKLVQDLLRVIRNKVRVQLQLMGPCLSLFLPPFDKSWV